MSGEAVSIKGTKNGLVILFDPDLDPEDIKNNLKLKMEKSNGFFKGARFSFSNSREGRSISLVDELEVICRQYGLIPSVEVSWPPDQRPGDQPPQKKKQSPVVSLRQPKSADEQAALISRTIRSGQQITSKNSLFIMGDVNPGAEVMSEGSIYIMGSCRGIVHAGCAGNILAEVFAFKFQPTALRIGTIASDQAWPDEPGPHVAGVSRGKIVFARY
ncbi:MAG: septum site-determining protein MinC [Actinobacteria bacterium]|nr:septum site-determining protein MinC [Actinomycetota bacterium]